MIDVSLFRFRANGVKTPLARMVTIAGTVAVLALCAAIVIWSLHCCKGPDRGSTGATDVSAAAGTLRMPVYLDVNVRGSAAETRPPAESPTSRERPPDTAPRPLGSVPTETRGHFRDEVEVTLEPNREKAELMARAGKSGLVSDWVEVAAMRPASFWWDLIPELEAGPAPAPGASPTLPPPITAIFRDGTCRTMVGGYEVWACADQGRFFLVSPKKVRVKTTSAY